jgi:hypothetical protein
MIWPFNKKPRIAHSLSAAASAPQVPAGDSPVVSLLIAEAGAGPQDGTRFGGQPLAPREGFVWPTCASCESEMQFQGQLRTGAHDGDDLLLLFMCQSDPGMCDEWDANGGGNKVVAVRAAGAVLAKPADKEIGLRPTSYAATIVTVAGEDYDTARSEWSQSSGKGQRQVLGQIGGRPAWLQGEEIPSCDACSEPMSFVAQLEEGPDARTAMNFGGGGCAYVYRCMCSDNQAKMLWQS